MPPRCVCWPVARTEAEHGTTTLPLTWPSPPCGVPAEPANPPPSPPTLPRGGSRFPARRLVVRLVPLEPRGAKGTSPVPPPLDTPLCFWGKAARYRLRGWDARTNNHSDPRGARQVALTRHEVARRCSRLPALDRQGRYHQEVDRSDRETASASRRLQREACSRRRSTEAGAPACLPAKDAGHCACTNCKYADHAGSIIIALDV